ncbi:MAG: cobyrinate a,c-diamide synthase [Desulfotalea sp.]
MTKSIIIAGTHSGAGKTTVTLGLMAALMARGLKVQPFKSGPDFIDPTLHKKITYRQSYNLDMWMMSEEFCRESFSLHNQDCDISVIEGVMGMFDGDKGSSHYLGQQLNIPTILVIDAKSMAQSAAAIVKGFESLSGNMVRGVIANNIASPRHLQLVKDAIDEHCHAKFLGHLPRSANFSIPSRHLGLHLAEDEPISKSSLKELSTAITEHIDLDKLLEISQNETTNKPPTETKDTLPKKKIRIAVARDRAFCFYYQDNFELLEKAGAELLFFSPINDKLPPENIQGMYIGGGYPELFAKELASNISMKEKINNLIQDGLPCYAECGGFMYLTKSLTDIDNKSHKMVGTYDTNAKMNNKRASLGYREVTLNQDCILGSKTSIVRGHEFHYSNIKDIDSKNIYNVDRGGSGYIQKNCLASYIHLHFGSAPQIAENFIKFCRIKNQAW